MFRTPPIPEELARWLLTHEAGPDASPEALVAAAEQLHVRLRQSLIVFLGQTGFDAMWTRAMDRARREVVWPGLETTGAATAPPQDWALP